MNVQGTLADDTSPTGGGWRLALPTFATCIYRTCGF
jgi:hypothetical protein